ncbi:hypothetical protein BN130_1933 [Cronobacter malonaticus 507]|nr:hypothetical protein BN130_1933 [Cronobacter malonaticus 507]
MFLRLQEKINCFYSRGNNNDKSHQNRQKDFYIFFNKSVEVYIGFQNENFRQRLAKNLEG